MRKTIILKTIALLILCVIMYVTVCFGGCINSKNRSTSVKEVKNIDYSYRIQRLSNSLSEAKNEINIARENYITEVASYKGTVDTLTLLVKVLDVEYTKSGSVIKGVVMNRELYSGLIELTYYKQVELNSFEIYLFTTEPVLTRGDIPQVKAISIKTALSFEKNDYEAIKQDVSTFLEHEFKYKNMTLDEIIEDGNKFYYTWTDEQILKYQDYIKSLGYTEEYEITSTVFTDEQLIGVDEHEF